MEQIQILPIFLGFSSQKGVLAKALWLRLSAAFFTTKEISIFLW